VQQRRPSSKSGADSERLLNLNTNYEFKLVKPEDESSAAKAKAMVQSATSLMARARELFDAAKPHNGTLRVEVTQPVELGLTTNPLTAPCARALTLTPHSPRSWISQELKMLLANLEADLHKRVGWPYSNSHQLGPRDKSHLAKAHSWLQRKSLERPPKPVFFEDFLELLELRPWKSLLPESCWELVHTTRDIQHYSTSEAMTTEMLQVLLHKFEQRDMDHSGCDLGEFVPV